MIAPVTSLYAALAGVLVILLAYRVVRLRRSERVGLGDGDNKGLARAIAVHRNAIEYLPMALVLLLIYEINGGQGWLLHAVGATLIVARLLHARGLGRHSGESFGRVTGTALTWLVILALAVINGYRII